MKIVNKKNIYILFLSVVCLLMIVIIPTYAKFGYSAETGDNIVGLSLDFDIGITGAEEYERLVIPAGKFLRFNIKITNNIGSNAYYGVWYRMAEPDYTPSGVSIGRVTGSTVSTSASIASSATVVVPISIINDTDMNITIDVGVSSSTTGVADIEYLDGKYLITGEVARDISISSITIDGVSSSSLPTDGLYELSSYTCTKGSELHWSPYTKSLSTVVSFSATAPGIGIGSGSGTSGVYKSGDTCSLTFTTSTDYTLLNEMLVGSYVAYEGDGGYVEGTSSETSFYLNCKTNGSASASSGATESPNSCLGQNAREDTDGDGYTYGWCYGINYKYYTTGWRIAYIKDGNVHLISAGAPECIARTTDSAGNELLIKTANTNALKYCNETYVDGYCNCTDDDDDGICDYPSSGVWALNDTDFYYITKAISGVGKRLTSDSSSLGDEGGLLGTTKFCYNKYSYQECGYNNDLLDNGGYYHFASQYTGSASSSYINAGVYWSPAGRKVNRSTGDGTLGLRPIIKLLSTVYVTGGSGTMDDPYTIGVE